MILTALFILINNVVNIRLKSTEPNTTSIFKLAFLCYFPSLNIVYSWPSVLQLNFVSKSCDSGTSEGFDKCFSMRATDFDKLATLFESN